MTILKDIFYGLMIIIMTTPAMADLSLEKPDKPLNEQWMVAVGGWSKHMNGFSDGVTNETHNIFAVEHDGWSAGYFKNSYGRDTFFVAKVWRKEFLKDIEGSAAFGISRGYTRCIGDDNSGKNICPVGWIGISYTKYKVVPTIKVIPAIDDNGLPKPAVIIFSPEVRF